MSPTSDLCGCRASLVAFAAILAAGVALQAVFGFGFGRTAWCLALAIGVAAVAKVRASERAEARLKALQMGDPP